MTEQSWLDWCTKQLGDLSARLLRQGYGPQRIQYLSEHNEQFAVRYGDLLTKIDRITEDMIANPSGYHHYDAFSRMKMDFLNFTSLNRARFLEMDLLDAA